LGERFDEYTPETEEMESCEHFDKLAPETAMELGEWGPETEETESG